LKVERRDNSVFISHSNLTIFANKFQDKATHETFYNIRVHKAEDEQGHALVKVWKPVGMMDVAAKDFQNWAELLLELHGIAKR
jgi:hypothetical protein